MLNGDGCYLWRWVRRIYCIFHINEKHSTDWPSPSCSQYHGGTSAAAAIASGIYALVMSIRPDLTWRDFQHLTVEAAIPIQTSDKDWTKVANGRMFNHKYGFGKLDATRLIDVATNWTLVGPQANLDSGFTNEDVVIHDNNSLIIKYSVFQNDIRDQGIKTLEHISVTVSISINRRGRLYLNLTSPSGYVSILATSRIFDKNETGFRNWTFSSVKHWNEALIGDWKLSFSLDNRYLRGNAVLHSYRIVMYGEKSSNTSLNLLNNNEKTNSISLMILVLTSIVVFVGFTVWSRRKGKYSEFHELSNLEKSTAVDSYI